MVLVAKRKVGETWPEVVERRAREFGAADQAIDAFNYYRLTGWPEYKAAFRALREVNALWPTEGPEDQSLLRGRADAQVGP